MGIAFALAAAAAFGAADFVGGVASRRSGALLVALIAQVAGFLIVLPALVFLPGVPTREALLWGAMGGVFGGLGLFVFYRALAGGVMAVVSPVTAAVSAGLPVVVGVAGGERISPLACAGLTLGLVAVALVGWAKGGAMSRGAVLRSIGMAVMAGIGFGLFFTCLGHTPHDSGAWPLAAARMGSLAVLATIVGGVRGEWHAHGTALRLALVSGVLDMGANALFLLSTRHGDLAVAAVVASQYPVITVLLSLSLLGERLHLRQFAGVGLALGAVALIAAG